MTDNLTPEEVEALYPIRSALVYENGIVVFRSPITPMKKTATTARKGIYEMSRKSKLKLTHLINNSPVKFKSMITLTWGDFLPPIDGKELKRQLNLFLNKFRYRFKGVEYFWFLEFQKSGKPHIHVLTSVEPSNFDRVWFMGLWSKITVYDAHKRLKEGKGGDYNITQEISTETLLDEWSKAKAFNGHAKVWELFRKEDGAFRYALKYATKAEQKLVPVNYGNVGRFWGNSKNVIPEPIGAIVIGEDMTEEEFRKLIGETKAGQLPLIPKYIFQKSATDFINDKGLTFTKIIGKNIDKFVNRLE